MSGQTKAQIRAALAKLKNQKDTQDGDHDDSHNIPVISEPAKETRNAKPQNKQNPINTGTKNNKYQDINNISLSVSRSASEWEDEHFLSLRIFDLDTLTIDETVLFGEAMIQSINTSNVTANTVSMMLYLAVSCRSTLSTENYLLTKPPGMKNPLAYAKPSATMVEETGGDDGEESIDNLFEKAAAADKPAKAGGRKKKGGAAQVMKDKISEVRDGGRPKREIQTESKDFQACAYSYLAAFLMRLQCRQPNAKMLEAINRAKSRYSGFYDGGKTVLDRVDFTEDILNDIREVLARKPEITSTWVAWIAYNENERTGMVKQDLGLMEYLATQVFAYQGMHVVTQTLAIHQLSAVPLGLLLREMDCQMTRAAVGEIYKIVKDYHRNQTHPNRKTYYRYARVWNEGYFSKVQSKSCAQLLYLAARVVKDLDSKSGSDPTEIYAVKDMSDATKERLDKVASKLIDFIWAQAEQDEDAGDIWKQS